MLRAECALGDHSRECEQCLVAQPIEAIYDALWQSPHMDRTAAPLNKRSLPGRGRS
jgi:hypothetical protein